MGRQGVPIAGAGVVWSGLLCAAARSPPCGRAPDAGYHAARRTTHKVYLPAEILGAKAGWVEGVDIRTQYTTWDFMRRPIIHFLIVAMGPIFGALMGAFIWLAVAEWRVRRRYPSTYDSLF